MDQRSPVVNDPATAVVASREYQRETDHLVRRLADYTAATSAAGFHGLAADVRGAWEESLVANDVASATRLVALAHAIQVAGTRHQFGMIG